MARIKGKDLYLKDDDQIYFGDNQEAALWYKDGELQLNYTISGTTAIESYHLVQKSYVDNGLATVSGASADSVSIIPPTVSGGESGETFFDPIDGIPYFYDSSRGKWLASDRTLQVLARDGSVKGAYLRISGVNNADTGYYTHNDATIVGVFCTSYTGDTTHNFELRDAGAGHAYIFDFTYPGALSYINSNLNIDIDQGTLLQCYVADSGSPVSDTICQILVARRYDV